MAEIASEMPNVPLKSRRYPWAEWFDGRVWVLTPGTDFTIRLNNFLAMAYGTARRKRGRVHIIQKDGKLYLQFVKDEGA